MASTSLPTLAQAKRLSDSERWPEALRALDALAVEHPAHAEIYFRRALAKDALRDRESAIADLDIAIGLEPTEPAFLCFRGRFLIEAARCADGIADMDRTIIADLALGSEYYASSARLIRAVAHLLAGDVTSARKACFGLPRNSTTFIAGRLWEVAEVEQGRMGRRPSERR